MQKTIGAPGEEAAQVGPGMVARRSGEPGQIGSDGSVELLVAGQVSATSGATSCWIITRLCARPRLAANVV
jgi:hypothetical protein